MSLKPQLSFASGELDPILHDRVTLERFQNGLATARNVVVGKTGSVLSRFSRSIFLNPKYGDKPFKMYLIPNKNLLLTVGMYFNGVTYENAIDAWPIEVSDDIGFDNFYVEPYDGDLGPTFLGDLGISEDQIAGLHFTSDNNNTYIFNPAGSSGVIKVPHDNIGLGTVVGDASIFDIPPAPLTGSFTQSASGFEVTYAFSYVINGQESKLFAPTWSPVLHSVLSTDDGNIFTIRITSDTTLLNQLNEMRAYQKPLEGGEYGLIGTTSDFYIQNVSGTDYIFAKFHDYGITPDFGNSTQSLITNEGLDGLQNVAEYQVGTGVIYQQRLLLANFIDVDPEAILASRPGYRNNFYRDFPYSSDSALKFKAGSSGTAKVLRMIEKDGLVVFTTVGVFVSVGILSPTNLALEKRGNWIIDEDIPPLAIPGGLFFVDKTTNSVRQLVYSQELGSYDSVEQSIFSDHLFKDRTIVSWAYQEGTVNQIIVVFSDGNFATFTYSFEHQMRAWTRHDSKYPIEQVEASGVPDATFFTVNKNGQRHIEVSIPRYVPAARVKANPEVNMGIFGAFMDGAVVDSRLLNVPGTFFTATPVTPGDWEGNLLVTGEHIILWLLVNPPEPGKVWRFFHPVDHSSIDLTLVSVEGDYSAILSPSEKFPEEYADNFRMYDITTETEGADNIFGDNDATLEHLEGEEVCVMVDGYLVSSPYNDNPEESLVTLTVTDGKVTLPEGITGAIIVVGRPIVADIQTLNMSTVEQSPVMIESLTVNKMYVRVHNTKGLFASNKFPEEATQGKDGNSVLGMENLDDYDVPENNDIIGNRYKPPISKRIERTIPGSWDSQGKMSIRQVDPFHFEILSIIADVEILNRSNR